MAELSLEPAGVYKISPGPGSAAAGGLVSPYALSVEVGAGSFLEIGRFSLGVLSKLQLYVQPSGGEVFRCGAFCEANANAAIVVGSEHDNGSMWNITLGGQSELFNGFGARGGMRPAQPLVLGDNVVLSTSCTVLSGATIGDGAVIGANALVTRDCDPFGIYGGVPAKKLKERFGPDRQATWRALRLAEVHAHHLPKIAGLVRRIETGEITLDDYLAEVTFLRAAPKLHFRGAPTPQGFRFSELVGVTVDGAPVTPETHQAVGAYINQDTTQPFDWRPDIFHALGLC